MPEPRIVRCPGPKIPADSRLNPLSLDYIGWQDDDSYGDYTEKEIAWLTASALSKTSGAVADGTSDEG